jgi:biopolymer transport protein TolR
MAELKRTPKRKVLVKADSQVNYGKVVTAMALLQKAGAPSVGLVTQDNETRIASKNGSSLKNSGKG